MVSGGPYGIEDIVAAAGYRGALLILLITPVLWSLPTALMVGELSSAMPVEGGFYIWVTRGMGRFWGAAEAWLSLAASIFDMAIYPTLFVAYLGRLAPALGHGAAAIAIGIGVIAAAVVWNLFGAEAVGEGSVLLGAALLAPFVILVAFAVHTHVHTASHAYTARPDIVGGLMIAMWNYMGWDNASTVAGEVEDPQRTYPIAMLSSVAIVAFSYMVPVAAMWFAHVPLDAWTTGSWVDIARSFGGGALALAIVAGGMMMGGGMFNSLAMSYSRLPLALADDGLLPRAFAKKNRWGVPWVSLLACGAAWAFCLGIGFKRLVWIDILLYGSSLILEFIALVLLRIKEPDMHRPFRIPGGTWAAAAIGVGPLLFLIIALFKR